MRIYLCSVTEATNSQIGSINEHTTAENSTLLIKVMQRTWSCRGYSRRRRSVDAHLAFNGGQASLDLVQNGGEGGKVVLGWHGRAGRCFVFLC